MSAEHPDAVRLDALAAGDEHAPTRAHVDGCDACRAYVAAQEHAASAHAGGAEDADAFIAHLEGSVAAAPAARRGSRVMRLAWVGAPLLAAAAALLLFVRSPDRAGDGGGVAPAPSVASVRFKGRVQLAVVRDRDGQQVRVTTEVSVRAGDRLRAEIAVDGARPITCGVLTDDGEWALVLPPTLLEAGTHYSDKSVRIDDRPTAGFVIAGEPGAVDAARATRSFEAVSVIPIVVEP